MSSHRGALTGEVVLTASSEVGEEVGDLIGEGLDDHNLAAAGPGGREPLWIVARDADGAVLGGLKAGFDYSWLFIDWLWVRRDLRGRGIGTRLMRLAEHHAARRGSTGIYVQTASFQAPAFYHSLGYEEFGRLNDYPPGHAMVWLRKTPVVEV